MNLTEESATFTPGPWVVKHDKKGLPFIGVESDPWTYAGTVATVEQEKDARLIAACPEMYEMCKLLEECMETIDGKDGYDASYELAKVREILAKVEGGEG